MDLGDPGKWRKSKVDSFIRRHLAKMDLGVARYYEMCMFESKGNLLPSYALLLDNSLVITENPPKSVLQSIPLDNIKDISLIADRHSLIKGKNSAFICQHVAIEFSPVKVKKVALESGEVCEAPQSDEDTNSSHDGGSSEISVSPVPSTVVLEKDLPVPEEILQCYEPSFKTRRDTRRSPVCSNYSPEKVRTWPKTRKHRGKQDVVQRAHWWNRKTHKENVDRAKVDTVELYFYQRESEFVNELSLVWNRQQMKNTEDVKVGGETLWVSKSLRAAERLVSKIAQDWEGNGIRRDILRKVIFLHKCLGRYEHLKYLCWKNAVIMTGLMEVMMYCIEPLQEGRDLKGTEFWENFDKIAVYALLMDIFRTLFEACSVVWFKDGGGLDGGESWDHKVTIFDVTKKLISSILKCPFLPRDHRQGCFLTVTDPQKFIKASWLRYDDESSAKMAKLICTAHNASVALLFELFAIAHFLPTLVQTSLVTCGVRRLNLEHYVRLSVTQIINILWNYREPLNSAQTMILYRQVWNLHRLVNYDRSILIFIRNNFSEEFYYYATTKGIKTRIPDQYAIKPKVIDACDLLLEEIVGNKPSERHS